MDNSTTETRPKYEEASKCPRCKQPGKLVSKHDAAERSQGKVHVFECANELCITSWDRWLVQVLPNGEIPDRTKGPKQFSPLTPGQESMARATLEQIQLNDQARRQ